jgi:hypothetical protein
VGLQFCCFPFALFHQICECTMKSLKIPKE